VCATLTATSAPLGAPLAHCCTVAECIPVNSYNADVYSEGNTVAPTDMKGAAVELPALGVRLVSATMGAPSPAALAQPACVKPLYSIAEESEEVSLEDVLEGKPASQMDVLAAGALTADKSFGQMSLTPASMKKFTASWARHKEVVKTGKTWHRFYQHNPVSPAVRSHTLTAQHDSQHFRPRVENSVQFRTSRDGKRDVSTDSKAIDAELMHLHYLAGHPSGRAMLTGLESGAVQGVVVRANARKDQLLGIELRFTVCAQAKSNRHHSHPTKGLRWFINPGDVIAIDHGGPFKVKSLEGHRFVCIATDLATGYPMVHTSATKAPLPAHQVGVGELHGAVLVHSG
jgi:hypothetical protein